VFVIKDTSGTNHNLYFTEFAGSSTGNISFVTRVEEYPTGLTPMLQEKMIKAYPNPTSNELYIETDFEGAGPLSLHIYDLTGRLVNSRIINLTNSSEPISINTRSFEPGIYLLQLSTGEEKATSRIVIR
jgi:hypothetical protein